MILSLTFNIPGFCVYERGNMKVFVFVLALVACALASPKPVDPSPKIINGQNAARGQFNYIVSFQRLIQNQWRHNCGGSIIGRNYILTAAHCIGVNIPLNQYRIVAGILNIDDVNVGEQIRNLAAIISHELFPGGPTVAPHDVALLRLSTLLNWSDNIRPIALPALGHVSEGTATLAGWGAIQDFLGIIYTYPNTLQFAELPVISDFDCNQRLSTALQNRPHPFDPISNVCTGSYVGFQSACGGDSGGPLTKNGRVIGIVSWGLSPCGSGANTPTVYAQVSNYVDWIDRNTPDLQQYGRVKYLGDKVDLWNSVDVTESGRGHLGPGPKIMGQWHACTRGVTMKVIALVLAVTACALASPTPVDPSPKIINGQNAVRGQFNYIVSFQLLVQNQWRHNCGGSIIGRNYILTAAHCIGANTPLNQYRIVAGILNINDVNVGEQIRNIAATVSHELYPGGNTIAPHDIALLRLSTLLTYTDNIRPIALPPLGHVPEGTATLAGWGAIQDFLGIIYTYPNTLQFAELPVIGDFDCNQRLNTALQNRPHPFDPVSNICTGSFVGFQSACGGDSGGPLVKDGRVVGIVSWGLSPCGAGANNPSVYAQVSNYVDWIDRNTPDLQHVYEKGNMKLVLLTSALLACALASPKPVDPSPKIINGQNAIRGQFEYIISFQVFSSGQWRHNCGGSIIGRNYILTAAHCIGVNTPLSSYRIVAGILNLNDVNVGEQIRSISAVIVHELFPGGPVVAPHDVALLRLSSLLDWTNGIRPIGLPQLGQVSQGTATLAGWGAVQDFLGIIQTFPNTLQFAELPVIEDFECNQRLDTILGGRPHPFDPISNVCTGSYVGFQSACGGDSGGPLAKDGRIVGVVSWGISPCGAGETNPTVYAKVSNYVDWIDRNTPDLQENAFDLLDKPGKLKIVFLLKLKISLVQEQCYLQNSSEENDIVDATSAPGSIIVMMAATKVLILVLAAVGVVLSSPKPADPSPRIINGQNATRSQFPYIISFQRRPILSWSHICGGSIIGRNYILTAAHCIGVNNPLSQYRVVAGILNQDDVNVGEQVRSISAIISHELFPGGPTVAPHDIALLRLSSLLNWSNNVRPIPLPNQGHVSAGTATLAGWGAISDFLGIIQTFPNTLQYAELPVIDDFECNSRLTTILQGRPHPFDALSNICTGSYVGFQSACGGDSGGPLTKNGRIIGVVSWGITPCGGGANNPTVYAKVASYVDWIDRNTPDIQE
ncbi:transmembrane protease serine 9-like [Cylas formicarius]|uniref:transmembrane protease serine 9-like n=1 Tax=Cylas formicarius TaxID=197179 RepID=UPI002958A191|nr:transmembrane protease serine 9-like [Cylas formicarius]